MNNLLTLLLLVLIILILSDCRYSKVPSELKKNFKFCLDKQLSNETNGNLYIFMKDYRVDTKKIIDKKHKLYYRKNKNEIFRTHYYYLMLYDNGLYTEGYFGNTSVIKNNKYTIDSLINLLLKLSERYMLEDKFKDNFYNHNVWGIYKISNDTIITRCVNHPYWMVEEWVSLEKKIILKTDTIIFVGYKCIKTHKDEYKKLYKEMVKRNVHNPSIKKAERIFEQFNYTNNRYYCKVYKSIRLPSIHNIWLLKQKWIWCSNIKSFNYYGVQLGNPLFKYKPWHILYQIPRKW